MIPMIRTGAKPGQSWQKLCLACCSTQMVLGIAAIWLSSLYLFDFTSSTGQFLGCILLVNGALGLYGSSRRKNLFLRMHFLGAFITLLVSYHLISQVGRETQVDCALAELYLRNHAVEETIRKHGTIDLFENILNRVNELEDMMRSVQDGAVKAIEAKAEQHRLKLTDRNYIKAKLEMLQRHATELFEKVTNHPNITKSDQLGVMDPEVRHSLIRRIDKAEELLDKINKFISDESQLTFESYAAILHDLIESYVAESHLKEPQHQVAKAQLRQAHMELPNMKAAIGRQKTNAYHELSAGPAGEHLSAMQRERQLRQHEWNTKLQEAVSMLKPATQEPLEKMPQHCLLGVKYFNLLEYFGFFLLLFQICSAFCILSFMVSVLSKED